VTLIDTPGFDDTFRSDQEILNLIGNFLKATYARNILLTGVIYLHRITDSRMQGLSLRSLRTLRMMCGLSNYNNVAIATTMWSAISNSKEAGERESQLTHSDYVAQLIKGGAKVYRHDKEGQSAREIVRQLLPKQNRARQTQEELKGPGVEESTSAGTYAKELEEIRRRYEEQIHVLQRQVAIGKAENQEINHRYEEQILVLQRQVAIGKAQNQEINHRYEEQIRLLQRQVAIGKAQNQEIQRGYEEQIRVLQRQVMMGEAENHEIRRRYEEQIRVLQR
jgi:hypothetical protein